MRVTNSILEISVPFLQKIGEHLVEFTFLKKIILGNFFIQNIY